MGNNLPSRETFNRCNSRDLATLVNQIGGGYKGIAEKIIYNGLEGIDVGRWNKEIFDKSYSFFDKEEDSFIRSNILWLRLERIQNGSADVASPTETRPAAAAEVSGGNGSSSGGGGSSSDSAGPRVTPDPITMRAVGPMQAKQINKERRIIETAAARARKAKAKAKKNTSNNNDSHSDDSSFGGNGASAAADDAVGMLSEQHLPGTAKKRSLSNDSAPAAAATAVKPINNWISYHDVSADHIIESG